jgi:hypothetical protein
VSEPEPLLDRAGIEEAFRRLGDRLAKRGVVADIYVFGGAAMALAYDSRRATRDVVALFKPHGIVLDEAQAVAAELGLPGWWLNEQASSYVAPGGDPSASRVFDHTGLRVFAASPEHLLAMKALGPAMHKTSGSLQRYLICTPFLMFSHWFETSSRRRSRQLGSGSFSKTSSVKASRQMYTAQ